MIICRLKYIDNWDIVQTSQSNLPPFDRSEKVQTDFIINKNIVMIIIDAIITVINIIILNIIIITFGDNNTIIIINIITPIITIRITISITSIIIVIIIITTFGESENAWSCLLVPVTRHSSW